MVNTRRGRGTGSIYAAGDAAASSAKKSRSKTPKNPRDDTTTEEAITKKKEKWQTGVEAGCAPSTKSSDERARGVARRRGRGGDGRGRRGANH